jgi:hypothetical protein
VIVERLSYQLYAEGGDAGPGPTLRSPSVTVRPSSAPASP